MTKPSSSGIVSSNVFVYDNVSNSDVSCKKNDAREIRHISLINVLFIYQSRIQHLVLTHDSAIGLKFAITMNNSGIISCLERLVKHIYVVGSNIRFCSKSKITVNKLTSKYHSGRKETFRLPKGSKPDYFVSYLSSVYKTRGDNGD